MSGSVTVRRRTVRAMTFALVLTVSAVLAHVLAGGMTPSPRVIVSCAAALLAIGWASSGRGLSARALAAVALGGQIALHVTFCLTMPGRMTLGSMFCGHSTAPAPAGMMRIQVVHPGATATSHQMLLMMLAHALGGVLVLLALRSAEAVAAVIAGVLTAILLWALPATQPPAARRRFPSRPVCCVPATALFAVSPRRGPPVSVCS